MADLSQTPSGRDECCRLCPSPARPGLEAHGHLSLPFLGSETSQGHTCCLGRHLPAALLMRAQKWPPGDSVTKGGAMAGVRAASQVMRKTGVAA